MKCRNKCCNELKCITLASTYQRQYSNIQLQLQYNSRIGEYKRRREPKCKKGNIKVIQLVNNKNTFKIQRD